MSYKLKTWWYLSGLVLLGFFFNYSFNLSLFYYLLLGFALLGFVHNWDGNREVISLIFLALASILSLFANSFQQVITLSIITLGFIYPKAKYYPISAFYKGFGYCLWILLPFTSLTTLGILFYITLSLIFTVYEVIHEAHHFNQDREEGRFSTAHLLNFRISSQTRNYFKIIFLSIGIIILGILWLI